MAKKKTAKVEKDSYEVLTTVAEAIARLRWDNHDVIQQYDRMTNQIEQIEYEARQEHGDFASDSVLQRAIDKEYNVLKESKAPRRKGGKLTTRITAEMKLNLTLDMLKQMKKAKQDQITLKDINQWFSKDSDKIDCRSLYGVKDLKILQVQWFTIKVGDSKVPLYKKEHYVSKKAPFPSYFLVNPWLKWLEQNEERLSKRIEQRRSQ